MTIRHDDRFFRLFFDASAPLILWVIYLFGIYAFSAVSCDTALAYTEWGGRSAVSVILMAVSVIVLLVAMVLLWRALHGLRRDPQGLLPFARVGVGLLGLLGIGWVAVPTFMMRSCLA